MSVSTPLILPTIVILMVAALEWRHTRRVAHAALVSGFVLLTAVMRWPAMSISEVVDLMAEFPAAALLVARCVGAGCFMYSVVRMVRAASVPW